MCNVAIWQLKWRWSCLVFQWRLLIIKPAWAWVRHVRTTPTTTRDSSANSAAVSSPILKPSAATRTPTSASASSPNNSVSNPINTITFSLPRRRSHPPPPSGPDPVVIRRRSMEYRWKRRPRLAVIWMEKMALISTSASHLPPGSSVKLRNVFFFFCLFLFFGFFFFFFFNIWTIFFVWRIMSKKWKMGGRNRVGIGCLVCGI